MGKMCAVFTLWHSRRAKEKKEKRIANLQWQLRLHRVRLPAMCHRGNHIERWRRNMRSQHKTENKLPPPPPPSSVGHGIEQHFVYILHAGREGCARGERDTEGDTFCRSCLHWEHRQNERESGLPSSRPISVVMILSLVYYPLFPPIMAQCVTSSNINRCCCQCVLFGCAVRWNSIWEEPNVI